MLGPVIVSIDESTDAQLKEGAGGRSLVWVAFQLGEMQGAVVKFRVGTVAMEIPVADFVELQPLVEMTRRELTAVSAV